MHFGLLPRANRGIFAINELPDLAGKIQVGLFNILQEGDVQIKGYPVRLPLDVMMVFTANPEDYTARGKIITPLKDRIGAEIRTHYVTSRADAMAITAQEAWVDRGGRDRGAPLRARGGRGGRVPGPRRAPDRQALGREPAPADQRARNAVSNAERRALAAGESPVVARVTDVYAALPSMTGKFELEYEGEMKGADHVARDLIRAAVATVFDGYFPNGDLKAVSRWFDLGGALSLSDATSADVMVEQAGQVPDLLDVVDRAGIAPGAPAPLVAAGVDFILEGLYAQKTHQPHRRARLPRRGASPSPAARPGPRDPVLTADDVEEEPDRGGGRKKRKQYN